MALLDDLLRVFGTSRVRLRWRWDRFKEKLARRPEEGKAPRPEIQFKPRRRRGQALDWLIPAEFPIVTVGYMIVCVALFFGLRKALHDAEGDLYMRAAALDRYGLMVGAWVHDGEWWRLVTANFLHERPLHLIMNGLGLWTLGQLAEETFGRARTVFVLLVSGVAGFALSAWAKDWQGSSLGASAAIFGLLGLLVAHGLWRRGRYGAEVKDRLIPWLLYAVIWSFVPRVDGWVHLGGGVAGVLLALVLAEKDRVRRLRGPVWGAIAVACLGVVGFSFWQVTR